MPSSSEAMTVVARRPRVARAQFVLVRLRWSHPASTYGARDNTLPRTHR